jgi:hypothetical protein
LAGNKRLHRLSFPVSLDEMWTNYPAWNTFCTLVIIDLSWAQPITILPRHCFSCSQERIDCPPCHSLAIWSFKNFGLLNDKFPFFHNVCLFTPSLKSQLS